MNKKVIFSIVMVAILISVSVIGCFADVPYDSNLQGLQAINSFSWSSEKNSLFNAITVTEDHYNYTGNVTFLDLSSIIGSAIEVDSSGNLASSTRLRLYVSVPSSQRIDGDRVVVQDVPGFEISVLASGASYMNPSTSLYGQELTLRSEFSYNNRSFNVYDTAAGSAQQIGTLRNMYYMTVYINALSDDPDNGYQQFTMADFANVSCLFTVGTAFSDFALAHSKDYNTGYRDGYSSGSANKNQAVSDAYEQGKEFFQNSDEFNDLIQGSYDSGYDDGYEVGESIGYSNGYSEAAEFGGFNLAQIPEAYIGTAYTYITSLFNFDLFGWNLLGIIGALMVVVVLGFVIRKVI